MGQLQEQFTEVVEEEQVFAVVPATLDEPGTLQNTYWVQAWKFGHFDTPYGERDIDAKFANDLVNNFKANTYGQDLPIDFEHGEDGAKGLQAAAWIRDMRIGNDAVYYLLEFTDDAISEIRAGKWRYFSPSFFPAWRNKETDQVNENVPIGGAITNRPFFKGMAPLNFSELYELREDFAPLTSGGRGDLPDSSFLYISPGGKKVDGKTTPDSLRHWPYKKADGSLDKAHLEAAERLIGRTQGVPDSAKSAALAKVKSLLGGSSNHREEVGMNEELFQKFCEALGIELPQNYTEENLLAEAAKLKAIVEPLKVIKAEGEKQQTFREQFPDEYEQMQQLKEARINSEAHEFAERYERFTVTKDGKSEQGNQGFSALTLEKVEECYREPSAATLKAVLDTVANTGLVSYSELGSSRTATSEFKGVVDMGNVKEVRNAFNEIVKACMVEDSLTYDEAIKQASKKEPDLAAAYHAVGMGG